MRRALSTYKAKGVRVLTSDGPGTVAFQTFGGPSAFFMVVLDKPLGLDTVLDSYPDEPEDEWRGGLLTRRPSKAEKQDELRRQGCLKARRDALVVACQYYPWRQLHALEPGRGQPVELSIGGFQEEKVFPARFVSQQGGLLTFEAIDPITAELFEDTYGDIDWGKVRKGYYSGYVHFVPTVWIRWMTERGFDPKLPAGRARTVEPYGEILEFDPPIPLKEMSGRLAAFRRHAAAGAKRALAAGEMSQREYDEAMLRLKEPGNVWISLSAILLMYVIPTRAAFDVRPMREDLAQGIALQYGEEFREEFL